MPVASTFEVLMSYLRWKSNKWKRAIVVRSAEFDEPLEV